jgi:hypothetical protein
MLVAASSQVEHIDPIVVGSILILLTLTVLNVVAVFKIITKAGYSGWWILLPLSPPVLWLATSAVLANAANSPFSTATSASYDWANTVGLFVVDGVVFFLSWVFFLVFAFSDWPVRRKFREQQRRLELAATDGAVVMQRFTAEPTVLSAAPVASTAPATSTSTAPAKAVPMGFMPSGGNTQTVTQPVQVPRHQVQAPPPSQSGCPTCSAENRASSVFCRQCGTRLSG